MTFETFMVLALIASVATGFITEGVKIWLSERGKTYYANSLAGAVAIVMAAITWVAYVIFTGSTCTLQSVMTLVILAILSWGASMVGYDKLKQMLEQFRHVKDKIE